MWSRSSFTIPTVAAISFCVFGGATPALADIINVPADYPTIQAGIDAAVDGDEVVVANGDYFTGGITMSFNGKEITVRSANGPENCVINLQNSGRAFRFNNGETADSILDGFTIINGFSSDGSAIFIAGSSPTIKDCVFAANVGLAQGAVVLQESNSIIIGCRFDANSSTNRGAGIVVSFGSNAQIINCEFNDNTADSTGGAIHVSDSSMAVTNCCFNNNDANVGAAVYGLNSIMSEDGCTFTENVAGLFGGGITNDNTDTTLSGCDFVHNSAGSGGGACATSSGSSLQADNCSFDGNESADGGAMFNLGVPVSTTDCTYMSNSANRGGAVYNSQCNLQSTNCLYIGNMATSVGGAMYNASSQPQVRLATIAGNAAPFGGGLYNVSSFPTLSNSILRNNTPDQIRNVAGSVTTATYSNIQGGWAGAGNIDADPLFVAPGTGDFHLMPGSPCIDAADNTAVPKGIDTDLDGNPRFVDDPATKDTGFGDPPIVDMGVYEFQALTCPWDLDSSGSVGASDLLLLLADWGNPYGAGDLLGLLADWGACP